MGRQMGRREGEMGLEEEMGRGGGGRMSNIEY